jgi:hypothetical protein
VNALEKDVSREAAAAIFRGLFGAEPPPLPPDPVPWDEWQTEVYDNDGTQPLYELDRVGGVLRIYLHEGQRQAWESLARFVFIIAGKQSGKTIFGPLWLFRAIQQLGSGDYLAISATYDLFKLKMLPAIKQLFVQDLGIARYWAGDRILELCDPETGEFGARFGHEHEKMWGRIILRSADSEEGMQSASAKAAWMDEPGLYDADVWKDVRGRVSLEQGPVLGTTTPYDLGWLKQQIYDPWVKGDPEIDVIQFSSRLSPFFPDAEYDSLRRTMQTYQFKMDYDAEFGRPPAAIYEDFIDDLRHEGGHLVQRFIIPDDWPRMVAIDPGVVNPGKLWVAHDTVNNEYYIYRAEKGGVRRTSKEHAAYDVKRARENRERVIWWAVGAKSEKYWREDYADAGAEGVREPDITDVEEGIDRGTQLIKEHRVFVFDDEYEFIDEIMRYARVIKDGEVTKDIKDKATFHLVDCYRYFAVQVVKPEEGRMTFGTQRWV